MNSRTICVSVGALLAATSMALPVMAQDTQDPAVSSEATQLGDIVVTARNRAERLQDVPLAISAFTSEALEQKGASSLADIALLTPGLNFESYASGGYPVITLRGLSATTITGFEGNVSTFFGGIYLPRAYMVDTGLVGLERIEVVKGPQSALYGRNAFAGAINYVPDTPPSTFEFEGLVTVGTDERLDYGLSIGGPIVEGISVQAGYAETSFDGTWDNAHPNRDAKAGGTTGKMGGYDNSTYFVSALLTPTDRFTINAGWNHTEKATEAAGRYNISRNTGHGNCSLVGGVYQFYCGELPLLDSEVDPRSQGLIASSDVIRMSAEYAVTDNLTAFYQFGRIISEAYSYDQTSINSVNGDSVAGVQFLGLPVGSIEGDSHEGRLTYDDGVLRVAGGVFSSDMTDDYATRLFFRPPLGTDPITPDQPGQIIAQDGLTDVRSRSIFGLVGRDFMEGRLNVTFEARYTEEEKVLRDRLARATYDATFDAFTPRLSVRYEINPDQNVYFSAAKGSKSGGFNSGNILAEERAFAPEENWTYEVGTKNRLMDGRLLVNANLFYVDWTDLQTLSVSGNPGFVGTLTRNVGAATAYGFEVDAQMRVTPDLEIGASYAYTNPRYADDMIDPRFLLMRSASGTPITICDDVVCPANGSIGGNLLARQSQHQATATVRYTGEIAARSFSVGADIAYKSKQYVDPLVLTWVPDRTLINLNASLDLTSQLRLEGFVKNLLDEEYVTSATYNLAGSNQVRYEGVLGERRTAGVTLRYRY